MEPKADHLTHDGALKLAKRIERYWKARGSLVTMRVEMFHKSLSMSGAGKELYAVRSDMRNGAPRG